MARLLILGGGCRGLGLARRLHEEGHAVRIVTRKQVRRVEIEAAGAECWIGDPDRLGTLREALEGVAVVCWLMGTVSGSVEQTRALHGPRLRSFLGSAIDSTARGVVYEAAGTGVSLEALEAGVQIAEELTSLNSIPLALIDANPEEGQAWLSCAAQAVFSILNRSALR